MKKTLDATHRHQGLVRECTNHMNDLATAASLMGQKSLAKDLYKMATDLNISVGIVCKAVGEDIVANVHATEKLSATMMSAMVASVAAAGTKPTTQ